MERDADQQALVSDRAATVALIETMSARLQSVVEAGADASSDDEHDPEGSTLAFERGQLVAQVARSKARLAEIDAAMQRLSSGSYGLCESCGQAIGQARLEALPAARLCITCASKGQSRQW
jgi:RNA polymerase-binding transcription factor DksA